MQFLEEWNQQQQQPDQQQPAPPEEEEDVVEAEEVCSVKPHPQELSVRATRVCAVCVQEPVITAASGGRGNRDQEVENGSDEDSEARPLKLREIKTLERQREREAINRRSQLNPPPHEKHLDNHYNSEHHPQEHLSELQTKTKDLTIDDVGFDSDDANDPFLQAVGGADKLLTGEAYQQRLLWEQEQKLRT